MKLRRNEQSSLPASGPLREALRERGQFWTPAWIAEAMVDYVTADGADHVFDPAVGAGAFFLAARKTVSLKNITLAGAEVDPTVLDQARQNGLSNEDLAHVEARNFLTDPPSGPFRAIVANPPYIRHHRLPPELKAELKTFASLLLGKPLDGRAGVHVYFLLQALRLLSPEGRLAFIMPADTCEGVFATTLWNWITANYCLEAVVTFAPNASPFPGVDTNPVIFAIRNSKPAESFFWARCTRPESVSLKLWLLSGFRATSEDVSVHRRLIRDALSTGLSRSPRPRQASSWTLGHLASVMRGVATGANRFFFLTRRQAEDLRIPPQFLLPAVGRTRDVPDDKVTPDTLRQLDSRGRPTLLFAPDGRAIEDFPRAVRSYLEQGEAMKLNDKPLIATRRPWYKMEARLAPPILFAYLGRRSARFIRNLARVVPLTGFLCIYPRGSDPDDVDRLWEVLQHPETLENLELVGKSYGDGAIKVEPRALERLPLPAAVMDKTGQAI